MAILIVTEAHFYAIDENNLNNIQLVDKLKLTHFHDGCLKAIFENNFGDFTKGYLPAFQSYGGQVFASHKFEINEFFPPKREKYIWNGLWKDEKKDFIVAERKIHKDPIGNGWKVERDRNVLFWAKKSWIQKDKPAIPYISSEPTTFSPKTTPVPTTLPPALPTTLAPALPTTLAPALPTTLAPTTFSPKTTPVPTTLPPALPTTLTPSTLAPTTAPAPTEPPKTSTNAPSKQALPLASTTDSLNSSSIPITTTVTASKNSGATIDDANSTHSRSTPSINDTLQTKVAALIQDASDSSSDFGCFLSENLVASYLKICGF
uniref:Uncharacterized protein n=1 Tax=Panagrolaimus davidi TaxID=227884 RepID=A0A914Q0U0_9BILA